MPDPITITPIQAFRATITPPGSKSLTNRALLLAALAEGTSTIQNLLVSDDTQAMIRGLAALGGRVDLDEATQIARVTGGLRSIPAEPVSLSLGNAGTAVRFLTAACCLNPRSVPVRIDGNDRMRQRPIGQLIDSLRQIGARIDFAETQGHLPLTVYGGGLRGGEITMPPTLSSQYISALLQVGPYCREGLTIRFSGPITSRPYVAMTMGLMARFGIEVDVNDGFTQVNVPSGQYRATDYTVEPDASSAGYFLAAAAIISGSTCTIQELGKGSLQGDVGFADVLHLMGAGMLYGRDFITVIAPPAGQSLRGIDIDLNAMPDMVQTLAVAALFAKGQTTIRNVGNLRIKETDRLAALKNELTKLGAAVEIDGDDLTITPPADGKVKPAAIETYDDHRMAMSFSVVGLRAPGITIRNPRCVDKTFPRFFEYLARLGRSQA